MLKLYYNIFENFCESNNFEVMETHTESHYNVRSVNELTESIGSGKKLNERDCDLVKMTTVSQRMH